MIQCQFEAYSLLLDFFPSSIWLQKNTTKELHDKFIFKDAFLLTFVCYVITTFSVYYSEGVKIKVNKK